MIDNSIKQLVSYALDCGLIEKEDETYCTNRLLECLCIDEYTDPGEITEKVGLEENLKALLEQHLKENHDSQFCKDLCRLSA